VQRGHRAQGSEEAEAENATFDVVDTKMFHSFFPH
jgi:hypothetical protein